MSTPTPNIAKGSVNGKRYIPNNSQYNRKAKPSSEFQSAANLFHGLEGEDKHGKRLEANGTHEVQLSEARVYSRSSKGAHLPAGNTLNDHISWRKDKGRSPQPLDHDDATIG